MNNKKNKLFDEYEEDKKNISKKEEELLEQYEDYDEDEDYEEEYSYDEEDEVIKHNNRISLITRILNIIFTIIIIAIIMIVVDVICVGKFNVGPFFAIPVNKYKDGGTKEYYGLGYKVIKYHQLQGRRDKELGFWSLKYNTDPITLQDVDLAIETNDNTAKTVKKYINKFVRIISTLDKVDEKNHKITLKYNDEDGKYTTKIICKISKDQDNLKDFEEGKEITIIGTIKNFKNKTTKEPYRYYISDCFAEQ